jgi:hypothetical protein
LRRRAIIESEVSDRSDDGKWKHAPRINEVNDGWGFLFLSRHWIGARYREPANNPADTKHGESGSYPLFHQPGRHAERDFISGMLPRRHGSNMILHGVRRNYKSRPYSAQSEGGPHVERILGRE